MNQPILKKLKYMHFTDLILSQRDRSILVNKLEGH